MLKKKNKCKKTEDEDKLGGILISDDDLYNEINRMNLVKPPNYIVLGDISLDQNERDYLQVHYKCREYQHLNRLDLEVDIIKLGIKHRYEKMGQGDDLENLADDEMIKESKELRKAWYGYPL